jgi:hypothetical protein
MHVGGAVSNNGGGHIQVNGGSAYNGYPPPPQPQPQSSNPA